MQTWQKWSLGILGVVICMGVLAYVNRTELILAYVRSQAAGEIASHRAVDWQQGPVEAQQSPSERAPNIVFILFDDLGINDISTFGGGVAGGRVPTPNIDRLAKEGVVFTQSYAGHPNCAPSRAQLMTGRYATRTGFEFTPTPAGMPRVVSLVSRDIRPDLPPGEYNSEAAANAPPYEEQGLPSDEVTIAEVLQAQGYHTVHIGKWHLGRGEGFSANDQGFDESLLMASGLFLPEDHPDVVNAKVKFDPIDRFLWASMRYAASYNDGEEFRPGGYLTDYWTDESLKVIEANRNRPFFLYLAHWATHTPLQATREDFEAVGDLGSHRLQVYAAMVRALDRSVGRIMAKLDEEGLAENTLIVLSSDNGGAGYIGLPEVNAPYRGFKLNFFEGGIRAPLFARWPARIAPGTKIDMPVAHIDVMPTLAAAAGADLPQDIAIDGRNLLPAMSGSGQVERADAPLFWNAGTFKVVRTGNWKLQVDEKRDRAWLYNLAKDPTEQVNLAASHPEKRAELQSLIDAHHQERRPPLYPSVTEMAVMVDKTLAEEFEQGDEYVYIPN